MRIIIVKKCVNPIYFVFPCILTVCNTIGVPNIQTLVARVCVVQVCVCAHAKTTAEVTTQNNAYSL